MLNLFTENSLLMRQEYLLNVISKLIKKLKPY